LKTLTISLTLGIVISYIPAWFALIGGNDIKCNSPIEQVIF